MKPSPDNSHFLEEQKVKRILKIVSKLLSIRKIGVLRHVTIGTFEKDKVKIKKLE